MMNTAIRFLIKSCVFIYLLVPFETKAQCGMTVDITADPPTPSNQCPGETILLTSTVTGGTGPYTYLWGDGQTTQNITITPPFYGEVYLMVTDATGCVEFGQIHIKAWVWTVEIVYNPTSICFGDSLALVAWPVFPPGSTFLWSTGETTDQIYILSSGTYSLTVTDPIAGCSASTTQTVFMSYWPTIDPIITGPSVLCTGQSATLIAQENPGYFFLWNTGEVTTSIDISTPGIYSVTVSNFAGCFGTDSIEVLSGSAPPDISAPQVLCNGQSGTVSVTNAGSYTNFLWNTGANTSSITINAAGTYSVTVTASGGCTATGSVTVTAGSSNINLTATTAPMTSCINPNGSINLTVTPSGSYSFLWSNGANTEDITGLTGGSYTVTVTDSGGCTSSSSYTVTSNVVLPTTTTNFTSTSCNLSNGAVDLTVTPAGTYTFLWSNGTTTEDLSNILAGTYSVTVTSSGSGCTASASVTVPNNNISINVTGITIPFTSCSSPNGAVDITASPSGTYTYIWSNGSTTEDLSNVTFGSYTVTVSAGGSCTSTATYVVPDNTSPPVPLTTTIADTCAQNTGAIDLNVTPPNAYTFLWSNGATTEDLSNIAAGPYSVTITASATGCTAVAIDTITTLLLPIDLISTPTASTCGQSNGAIDLNVTPVGTYSFLWSNGSNAEDLTAIPGGNYSVTVISIEGCTNTASILVPDISIPIAITGMSSPNTSCISQTGAVDISVDPPGMYSYVWSNGASTEDLNNIPAGVYSVTVTFGLTCINTQTFEVLNNITPIDITGNTTPNTSCNQPNGAIDVTINPPGSFIYSWSNGEISEDLQDLTGGTYSLTVTGSNGCTATSVFDIINTNSNFSFNGSILPNTSCISPNGSIDLTLTPAGTYSFNWSNGASTEDLQNLTSGNYSVTVADINNCALVESFSIDAILSYPVISSQVTPSTCGNSNGAIDISVTPLNSNIFSWSNGSIDEDQFNLLAADYMVTVTGANGCMTLDTIAVTNQNSNFTLAAVTMPNHSCINPNGSIDLAIAPPGSYSFLWSNSEITEDLQSIPAGAYSVTVTDVLNCSFSDTFVVASNTSAPTFFAIITPANCGANNGAINLNITSPGSNTFLWTTGSIAEDLQNLFPESYSVIVTDTNGCRTLDTFSVLNINNNFSLSAVSAPNVSCNSPNGGIDLTVTPNGTYTFSWSNGATSEDLTNLDAGSFIVTVTDNLSCSSTAVFVVDNNTVEITISSNISSSFCGADNGSIDLTVNPSSGNSFSWSNGATTEDVQNLIAGDYLVTITEQNGCSKIDTFTVPDVGSSISLSALPAANTNCKTPNGSIDLSVAPAGAYSFAWSNGILTEDLANLIPGIYTVTVSDINGCSSAGSYTIGSQTILPSITENISPSICGNSNGQIDLTVSPSGIYFFAWSNGDTNEDLQNVASGSYSVTVTSDNDCTASTVLVIPDSSSNFSISALASNNTSCTSANGTIDLTVTPAGNYNFLWSNGAITEDVHFLQPGIYAVTVTDNSSCSTTNTFTINNNVVDLVVSGTITPILCGELNGNIDLNVIPSSGNTYVWSNGNSGEDLSNLASGIYSVTVTGQNGCTWSSAFNVPASPSIDIELQADIVGTGDDSVTISVEVNIPLGAVDTLIWLPENLFTCAQAICLEQTILIPSQQTEIIVMVVDTNGCTAEARLLLDDEANPQVYIPNVFTPNGDGVNDFFTIYGNKDVEQVIELRIFDRWGNFVFLNNRFPPNEENFGWDGNFRHSAMNPAVYAYWARVRFVDGSEGFYKGGVTLVR